MERNFEAREWLGLIIGAKLYYEFTDKYPFEEKMNGLLKEVLKNHQKSVHQKPVFFETVPDYTEARLIKLTSSVNVETIFSFTPIKTFHILQVYFVTLWKYLVSYFHCIGLFDQCYLCF